MNCFCGAKQGSPKQDMSLRTSKLTVLSLENQISIQAALVMDGVVLEMLNEIPCCVCFKTWMALWMWNWVSCWGGQINDCCQIRQFFWPSYQWIKHCAWARANRGVTSQHALRAGSVTSSLAVSLLEIKDVACVQLSWQPWVCGRDGALLQFVSPYFIYTLLKSQCASVKSSFQDMTVLICDVAPPQVVKCQYLKVSRIMWL